MGARARDRQQRAGARAGEGRDAGGAAGGARARAGRVRVKWARRGGLWGGGGDAGGPGAGRGVDLPAGTPRSAEGWRCLLQGQEQEPFDRHQPFLPWGPHSCGELNCTAGGPSQQKGDPAPQGSPLDEGILEIKCFTLGKKKKKRKLLVMTH